MAKACDQIDVVARGELLRGVKPADFHRFLALTLLLAAPGSGGLGAQARPPVEGGMTISLGQPRVWTGSLGVASGALGGGGEGRAVPHLFLGAYRDLVNPVAGALGVQIEAYGGARGGEFDGGVRTRFVVPLARFGIGADYNLLDHQTSLILSALYAGRRGGLFGNGTLARLDYLPARDHSVTVGVEMPVFRRTPAGRARPRRDHVRLMAPPAEPARSPARSPARPPARPPARGPAPGPGLDGPLETLRSAAGRIRALDIPDLGRKESRPGWGATAPDEPANKATTSLIVTETRRFHAALARAFSVALAGRAIVEGESTARGERAATEARWVLLSDVLLPYNRLLGQVKVPNSIRGLGHQAEARFVRWMREEGIASGDSATAALSVFRSLLDIVEENRAATSAQWRDSRFVWLPLQYALLPEQHDTQAELDAIVALAVEQPFTEGNFVSYVINEQFQYQLSRTIRAAEEYHVLWTHDFRGDDDVGNPDEMAYLHVVRSYLAAMTERVRAYDRTGRFPVYMILHDEWFYELRNGRRFLTLLEDPTRYRLRLPSAFRTWEDSIVAVQATLREAIAASTRLQAQKAEFGAEWLRNLVKVQVSITNPADPSFSSWRLTRGIPVADNMMRDHRKLVFYDISEDDPYHGEALYTGAGVGEHYSNITWEDRSLLVQGPTNLALKHAARTLLQSHGVAPHLIPVPLQPRRTPPDYAERIRVAVEGNPWPLRALGVHNGVGYAAKRVNVAKAVLYTLMPAGSVVMVPDSFWNSEFWGSALLGAALRGVRVLIIAPSDASNSVAAFGTQILIRELLLRLLDAREAFAPEIAAAGGVLRLGVYDSAIEVTDIPGKVRSVRNSFAGTPWLRDLFGFPPEVYEDLGEFQEEIGRLTMSPGATCEFEYDQRTKLHLKANFFASREGWQFMTRPEWGEMMRSFVMQRIAQVQSRTEAVCRLEETPDAWLDIGGGYVQEWFTRLEPEARERVVFYSVMGSQNQNARSMVVDAEVAIVVAHWPSVIPYLDLISLVGQSRWVESPAEIEALFPPRGWLKVAIAHWFRLSF